MEQITKREGVYYYGKEKCSDADECYRLFRTDYNKSVGRAVKLRINRAGARRERIHGYGSFYTRPDIVFLNAPFKCRTRYRILGITDISYCRVIDRSDMPECLTEENIFDWIDWIFLAGNKALQLTGKRRGTGRKSKYYNRKYR